MRNPSNKKNANRSKNIKKINKRSKILKRKSKNRKKVRGGASPGGTPRGIVVSPSGEEIHRIDETKLLLQSILKLVNPQVLAQKSRDKEDEARQFFSRNLINEVDGQLFQILIGNFITSNLPGQGVADAATGLPYLTLEFIKSELDYIHQKTDSVHANRMIEILIKAPELALCIFHFKYTQLNRDHGKGMTTNSLNEIIRENSILKNHIYSMFITSVIDDANRFFYQLVEKYDKDRSAFFERRAGSDKVKRHMSLKLMNCKSSVTPKDDCDAIKNSFENVAGYLDMFESNFTQLWKMTTAVNDRCRLIAKLRKIIVKGKYEKKGDHPEGTSILQILINIIAELNSDFNAYFDIIKNGNCFVGIYNGDKNLPNILLNTPQKRRFVQNEPDYVFDIQSIKLFEVIDLLNIMLPHWNGEPIDITYKKIFDSFVFTQFIIHKDVIGQLSPKWNEKLPTPMLLQIAFTWVYNNYSTWTETIGECARRDIEGVSRYLKQSARNPKPTH